MSQADFVYLNVPGLLNRYSNPSHDWRSIVMAFTRTEIEFCLREGLLNPAAPGLKGPREQAVLMFCDFTDEGQGFLKTGAIDKWLSACDRKRTIEAYTDDTGLRTRLLKFRKHRATTGVV